MIGEIKFKRILLVMILIVIWIAEGNLILLRCRMEGIMVILRLRYIGMVYLMTIIKKLINSIPNLVNPTKKQSTHSQTEPNPN